MRILSLPGRNFKGNPYFLLFCDGLEGAGLTVVDRRLDALRLRFDVIHVHFPEHYVTEHSLGVALKLSIMYMSLFLMAKAGGRRIVWSVHDVLPFKRRHLWLLKPFMLLFKRLVDGYVFLNPSSQREFYENFPSARLKPFCVIAHGPYPVNEPDAAAVQARRKSLAGEENAFVVGFLGNIKPYKNIGALRLLPKRLSGGRPVRILVAGKKDAECGGEVDETLTQIESSRVTYINEKVSDATLNELISAVDVVFLPYERGWSSGFAMLVLCNRGRVLGSPLPVFADLRETFGAPWVYQYSSASELQGVLDNIAENTPGKTDAMRLSGLLQGMSFTIGGQTLRAFYENLLPGREAS